MSKWNNIRIRYNRPMLKSVFTDSKFVFQYFKKDGLKNVIVNESAVGCFQIWDLKNGFINRLNKRLKSITNIALLKVKNFLQIFYNFIIYLMLQQIGF